MASGDVQLAAEQDNIRAALEWALASGRFVDAAWLCIALSHFWSVSWSLAGSQAVAGTAAPAPPQLPTNLRLATMLSLYHRWRGQEAFQLINQYIVS